MKYCGKCQKPLNIIEVQIGENETEKMYEVTEQCDNCKIIFKKYNKKVIKPKKAKPESALSIISCVLASVMFIPYALNIGIPIILAFPIFLASIILALIDLGLNNKNKKHVGSIVALVFSFIFIVIGMSSCI